MESNSPFLREDYLESMFSLFSSSLIVFSSCSLVFLRILLVYSRSPFSLLLLLRSFFRF